jgi:hypothetical protein
MTFWKFPSAKTASLDATGVGLSVACLAHCLLFPTAAAAAPLLAPGLSEMLGADHGWHLALLALAAPIAIFALGWGTRASGAGRTVFLIGMVGLALMALGAGHVFGTLGDTAITLAGVSLLAGAHISNWRRRARAGHVHQRDCGMCEEHSHD